MIFKTTRCLIRPFIAEDLAPFMTYRNNLDWMHYQGYKGLSKDVYQRDLLTKPSFTEGAQLAVCLKATQQLIGDIYLKQETVGFWLGYTIAPEYARKGYGEEIIRGVIKQLQAADCQALYAGVISENLPSVRLLEKLGFSCVEQGPEENIYRLLLSGSDS